MGGIINARATIWPKSNMKFFANFLLCFCLAYEKKVPPRHPLQRLQTLVTFSQELMDTWYGFLPSQARWKNKFITNGARMERAFTRGEQRCGFFDAQTEHGGPAGTERRRKRDTEERKRDTDERYDTTNPRIATKQITTGFKKWAERYIAACSGQKKHNYQSRRMEKWNNILQAHIDRVEEE